MTVRRRAAAPRGRAGSGGCPGRGAGPIAAGRDADAAAPRARCARWAAALDLQRFAEERPFPATPRRRERARREGQFALSADLGAGLGLLAAAAALAASVPAAAGHLEAWTAGLLGAPPAGDVDAASAVLLGREAGALGAAFVLPVLGATAAVSTLAQLGQTGGAFSLQRLGPDLGRVNPLRGLARLGSAAALVDLGRAVLKAGAVAVLGYGPVAGLLVRLASGRLGLPAEVALGARTALGLLVRAAAVQLVAGGGEFFFRRWETERALRMTREEMREELRQAEGDPALRAHRRRRQRAIARRRMVAEVRRADLVLTNPTHVAVALRYEPRTMPAPVVVAKGADFLAERIRAVARAAGVPLVDNPPLARALYGGVKVGQAIPAALYRAVAEVLAFVWRVRGRPLPGV